MIRSLLILIQLAIMVALVLTIAATIFWPTFPVTVDSYDTCIDAYGDYPATCAAKWGFPDKPSMRR